MSPEEFSAEKTRILREHFARMHAINDRATASVSLLGSENIRNIITQANQKAPEDARLSQERIDEMVKAIHNV